MNNKETDVSLFMFKRQEEGEYHNPYDLEKREQASIRKGDVEELKKCWEEDFDGELGKLASDPLRQAKNFAIVVITLSSRSAIEGGLNPEIGFSMADAFVQKIEDEVSDIDTVFKTLRIAQISFAEKVRGLNCPGKYNPLVRKAKDYIFKNLHKKITVFDMASELGVNPDYLSSLFKKTENKTITNYILDEKLSMCENMLKYSDYSIQDISAYFAFCSQSHFTKMFKHKNGLTPNRYRSIYGKNNNSK